MGQSSDAILVFGIRFEDGFELRVPGVEAGDGIQDVQDAFETILLRRAGLDLHAPWSTRGPVVTASPLELVSHCSIDYPMHILAARGTAMRASRGYALAVNPAELVVPPGAVDAMRDFCSEFGLHWSEPGWILCSDLG